MWDTLLPYMRGLAVFAIDLAGHGDSDWESDGQYTIEKYVQDVSAAVASFDLGDVRLVGHSLGAHIAIRIAASGIAISKLGVVDFGPCIGAQVRQHARAQFASQLRTYVWMNDYADWLRATRPMLPPRLVSQITTAVLRTRQDGQFELKCDPALTCDENEIESDDEEILALLRKIRCSTLVVRGQGSAVLTPSGAGLVVSSIPKARLCTIPMAGHAVMLDNPEAFGIAMGRFLHSD